MAKDKDRDKEDIHHKEQDKVEDKRALLLLVQYQELEEVHKLELPLASGHAVALEALDHGLALEALVHELALEALVHVVALGLALEHHNFGEEEFDYLEYFDWVSHKFLL
jgi:hypothetical protein